MRDTAEHRLYVESAVALSRHGLTPTCRSSCHRLGFTLVELVVAMAILLVVVVGVLSSVAFAYTSFNDTEMRNTAKNIASYTLEYLRSRTVTNPGMSAGSGLAGMLGISSTGTYGWYNATTNLNGAFPSMIDTESLPIQADGNPCNYLWTYVKSPGKVDGDPNQGSGGGIAADGSAFRFSSKHPALPTETLSVKPLAWTTTLQGYVSVWARLPNNDVTDLASTGTQNPAPEDWNLARMLNTTSDNANGRYRTRLTDLTSAGAWTGLIVQYPGGYPSTPPLITSFTPLAGYVAKVYTTDADKVNKAKPQYNPYYTNVDKVGTLAYRGFRVLTQIVARTADRTVYDHVQYYDVTVTVLWMSGTRESNYELVSRIIAY